MESILKGLKLVKEPVDDQSLASKLIASFVPSNFHDPARDYLPETCITNFVTREKIEEELRKIEELPDPEARKLYDRESRATLASWICANAQKSFAIAVQTDLDPLHLLLSMAIFSVKGFDDRNLPLADPHTSSPSAEHFNKQIWIDVKIRDFYDKQWRCLAPVFSPQKYDYNLPYNCIFPFTKESVTPKVGAFGSVHKVRIHPDHQKHYSMQHVS
jgi:predicted DNA-binding protein (MmcQ/YjbR family)